MAWSIENLTDASSSHNVSFAGRGSAYVEGTFGGGTVLIKPIAYDTPNGTPTIATGSLYSLDGSTNKSADLPSGHYQFILNGATGGNVSLWLNDQSDKVISR